jgi:hypothetical protein
MPITQYEVGKAYQGVWIRHNPGLAAEAATRYTKDHDEAIKAIIDHYDEFCRLVIAELDRWPLIRRYFKHLIRSRLEQNEALRSDFILMLFDENNMLETRLERIHQRVTNFGSITKVKAARNKEKGLETDEKLLDLWNEVFIADLLLNNNRLDFTNLEKVVRDPKRHKKSLIW